MTREEQDVKMSSIGFVHTDVAKEMLGLKSNNDDSLVENIERIEFPLGDGGRTRKYWSLTDINRQIKRNQQKQMPIIPVAPVAPVVCGENNFGKLLHRVKELEKTVIVLCDKINGGCVSA